MKPTVGRIVHWMDVDGSPVPALITRVRQHTNFTHQGVPEENNYDVSLCVFYEDGQSFVRNQSYSVDRKRGHWCWPQKEN